MCPGKRREAYGINVFLDSGGSNFFRTSADAGIHNFKASIP
jgi:hypothetical protein